MSDVSISIGGRPLVAALSLSIAPGEVATLTGPSGCGKSTLLAWIGGVLAPVFSAQGQASLDGRSLLDLAPERRRMGILFQDDLLFPHLSVAGNLAFGMPRSGDGAVSGRSARRQAIDAALASAGLSGYGDRDPATLSGGQRARVALLRTMLAQPRGLLLDEPFGKLDAALREDFRAWVFAQAREAGLPVLMVTHDVEDARAAGGQVITLGV